MWWTVRRANIATELRDRFEWFGEDVLAHSVGAGELSSKGPDLDKLLHESRSEIVKWLQEKRDIRERRERLTFLVVAATFVVAVLTLLATIVHL
jgi:hypothetical protein